jgi:hypothetical protein
MSLFHIIFFFLLTFYFFLVWKDIRSGIFLLFAALPAYLLRISFFGFPTTLLELMLGITVGITIYRQGFSWIKKGVQGWYLPITLLLIAATIGIFISPNHIEALGIWKAYFLEPILFFLLVRETLRNEKDTHHALFFLRVGAFLISLFALFQGITCIGIPIPWDIECRVTGIFPYPNAIGLFVGPVIVLSIVLFFKMIFEKKHIPCIGWAMVAALGSATLFFSKTEAAWIAVPASLVVTGLFHRTLRLWAITVLILGCILLATIPTLQEKILLQDYSGQVRLKQWSETSLMLKDHWLFGAGLSGYPHTLSSYRQFSEIEVFQYPHTIVLNIWTELGLLGLIAAGWMAVSIIQTYQKTKKQSIGYQWIGFGCFAALLEMVIHGLVDVPYFKNDLSLMTWGILAILVWTATQPQEQSQNVSSIKK